VRPDDEIYLARSYELKPLSCPPFVRVFASTLSINGTDAMLELI
jgi:hypothetical protein